jgi:hypothetical protein
MIRTLEAERAGFDFSLVDESLGYSYEQRARYHQAALNLAREMENAGRRVLIDINRLLSVFATLTSTSSSSAVSLRLCTAAHWDIAKIAIGALHG